MVLLQNIRVRRLSIQLLVNSSFLLFLALLGGGDGVADAEESPGSGTPELRLSLREAIQAAIDNNVNVRLLKERIAAAQAQTNTRLGALLPNIGGVNRRISEEAIVPIPVVLFGHSPGNG